MKILLSSLNAKFIHSSLSLHSLKSYATDFKENIIINEFTINQYDEYIVSKIYKLKPDIIGFSCYIWNIEKTISICKILKKILPKCKIILGGPEVSYEPSEFLSYCDIVVIGEGEIPFLKILKAYEKNLNFNNIPSIAFKHNNSIILNNHEEKIKLDDIPFVYENLNDFDNKILYYESSRGCPYNCQYCLSSTTKGVNFLSINRVKSDLKFFLVNNVKQVKFVDRTFNAKLEHALEIWQFLIDNDNGVTNFHFEISGDILDDFSLSVLKNAREGLFQFEIGVQSTNKKTLEVIDRNSDLKKLFEIVIKIMEMKNIHVHLDLIAGLPFEDLKSFSNSFDEVYKLRPQQFQLGFLKLLRGSGLRKNAFKYELIFNDYAPFEILSTHLLTFDDIQILKGVESMLEKFYNSYQFKTVIKFLETLYNSPFQLYLDLWNFFESNNYEDMAHKKIFYYEFLFNFSKEFFKDKIKIVQELLTFDIFVNENAKNTPDFYIMEKKDYDNIYNDENIFNEYIKNGFTKKQIIRSTHIETFSFNILKFIEEDEITFKNTIILFDYNKIIKATKLYGYDHSLVKKIF